MELQQSVAQIRSLAPLLALSPVYSIQRKPWYKAYRAQCMIPFPMYSIKIVYIITFIAFKIYVRVELFIIPMVFPKAFPIEQSQSKSNIQYVPGQSNPIPIASYSYNCIYCARCNLGYSCRLHVPRHNYPDNKIQNNLQQSNQMHQRQKVVQKKIEV